MKARGLLAAFLMAAACVACEHVQPWQRTKLAHPTMATDSFVGVAAAHMQTVHEGAVGGGAAAESGCGCN